MFKGEERSVLKGIPSFSAADSVLWPSISFERKRLFHRRILVVYRSMIVCFSRSPSFATLTLTNSKSSPMYAYIEKCEIARQASI